MQWPLPPDEISEDNWQLVPEAFKAWRAWRVIDYHNILMLESITHRVLWMPRQEMIAECRTNHNGVRPKIDHPAPDPEHGCGLYSVKNPDYAKIWQLYPKSTETVVWGSVSIWGHIFSFVKGYLSEFAYPSMFIIPNNLGDMGKDISRDELADELSRTYQVEAVLDE
jgi:hypothetical protein